MKILAVDDDESILELVTEFLNAFGYSDVVTAASGMEALDNISAEEKPFDCLLVDIQMPQINGITLCKRIRMIPGYRFVPIIMLTAMSHKKYIDEAFTAGATDYVTKPFDFAELQNRLADAQRLIFERERAQEGQAAVTETKRDQTAEPGIKLSEPLKVENTRGVVGYTEFENYILQMSRARLFNSSVFAIKIRDIEKIHGSTSPAIFRNVIELVAGAIALCTKQSGNLVSYRGNGVFLFINHGRLRSTEYTLETAFNDRIGLTQSRELHGFEISVLVGECVHLRSITKSGAIFSLNKAIESVELRNTTNKDVVVLSKNLFHRADRSPEEAKLERRAYEVLLKDVLLEESSLAQRSTGERTSDKGKHEDAQNKLRIIDVERPN